MANGLKNMCICLFVLCVIAFIDISWQTGTSYIFTVAVISKFIESLIISKKFSIKVRFLNRLLLQDFLAQILCNIQYMVEYYINVSNIFLTSLNQNALVMTKCVLKPVVIKTF